MAPQKYNDRFTASHEKMFGEKPSTKVFSPLEKSDHTELNDSKLLDIEGILQYQSLVGALH